MDEQYLRQGIPKEELVTQTLLQLRSDLEAEGVAIELTWIPSQGYPKLIAELENCLTGPRRDQTLLQRILYRFSVPENQGKLAFLMNDEDLATLLLRRSMEKVVWRWLSREGKIP